VNSTASPQRNLLEPVAKQNDIISETAANLEGDAEKEPQEQEIIYFEPKLSQIVATIQKPIKWVIELTSTLYRLEKDLVPLIETKRQSAFLANSELPEVLKGLERINQYLRQGLKEPNDILQNFKAYSYIIVKSANSFVRSLVGEHKQQHLTSIDIGEIKAKLQELQTAKVTIDRLYINEKNTRLFQIQTKQAKAILSTKVTEIIQAILTKLSELCSDNIERIRVEYIDLQDKLGEVPKKEQELIELKALIT